jgi:hypothetical protein
VIQQQFLFSTNPAWNPGVGGDAQEQALNFDVDIVDGAVSSL